jgi:hypothetical protein
MRGRIVNRRRAVIATVGAVVMLGAAWATLVFWPDPRRTWVVAVYDAIQPGMTHDEAMAAFSRVNVPAPTPLDNGSGQIGNGVMVYWRTEERHYVFAAFEPDVNNVITLSRKGAGRQRPTSSRNVVDWLAIQLGLDKYREWQRAP